MARESKEKELGEAIMAIRQIRTIGDDILKKECKPVKEITPRMSRVN